MTTTIDNIINELAAGKKISEALSAVSMRRQVFIPYKSEWFDIDVRDLKVSKRTINSLMRSRMTTLTKLMTFIEEEHNIMEIRNLGVGSCQELMEAVLDHAWKCMNDTDRAEFLIDFVARNKNHLRA